uniref:Uncharacterized protein n=1 Tax=Anguilla anguilla TaxID=7936 RepID=A0A0E9UD56_ANGAN
MSTFTREQLQTRTGSSLSAAPGWIADCDLHGRPRRLRLEPGQLQISEPTAF